MTRNDIVDVLRLLGPWWVSYCHAGCPSLHLVHLGGASYAGLN